MPNRLVTSLRMIFLTAATVLTMTLGMILMTLCSIVTLGQAQNFMTQFFSKSIGRVVLFFAGVKVKFDRLGAPVQRPAIYISNHSSTLDIFLIIVMGLPKVRYVAKHELLYNPLFGIMGALTGQIFIKRQDSEKAVATLNRAYAKIRRQGLSLYMAPEGTRQESGKIGPFKKGAFRMALALQYPIVPIHFAGARQLCPGKTLQVKPGTVIIRFYPAIDTSSWTLDNLDEQIAKIRQDYIRWEEAHDKLALTS
ncbi:MAG: 1-acyl-sn-glycerol-3-phosphate acyltransferase [Syntrophorhabdaceae bacterium]|nr:1-acyl-sn-glycerol-3-phosphate acyltransferase [Syntrophorhabdaceae bacterium]